MAAVHQGGGGGGMPRITGISNTKAGGPGVTTTHTPGDCPIMAELPESPAPIVIDDGEIPMAASFKDWPDHCKSSTDHDVLRNLPCINCNRKEKERTGCIERISEIKENIPKLINIPC